MGLGGMIEGYRQNGLKGAVVGAGGGFIASNLAALGLFAVMGTVPFIPFALITGVAGTMGGKILTSLIWKKDIDKKKVEEFRAKLKKNAVETANVLRDQRLIEDWAQKQVETQVDSLGENIEQETESVISSTEITLKVIAADMAGAEKKKEQKLEQYRHLQSRLEDVRETVIPVVRMIFAVGAQTD